MWTLVKCREQADLVSSDESVEDGEDYPRRNMILIPDSSEQDALSTSPVPVSMIPTNDILGSLQIGSSQTIPYDSIQFTIQTNRRHNSSMPTMDSTVSSAKPEPELNIGTLHHPPFLFSVFYPFARAACRYYKNRDRLRQARERKTGGIAGRDSG